MHSLSGMTLPQWLALLRENRFSVDPPYRAKARDVTIASMLNSVGHARVQRRYGAAIAAVRIPAPVFVIGHWRSGTTLLHELLSLDEQFAFPNLLQVSNPLTFLVREPLAERELSAAGDERRAMDNVRVSYRSPGEDEFAVAMISRRSDILGWSFPRNELYDRCLTLRTAAPSAAAAWQAGLRYFLAALVVRYGDKPLLLKSPSHTGKIGLIRQMFPDARFVHIHRNPFVVYQSTVKLHETAVAEARYQSVDGDPTDGILRRYADMYEAFRADSVSVPAGQLCEVRFEDLESNMVGELERVYAELRLPGFSRVQDRIEAYARDNAGYQKNVHRELDPALRSRIAVEWRDSFERWSYGY